MAALTVEQSVAAAQHRPPGAHHRRSRSESFSQAAELLTAPGVRNLLPDLMPGFAPFGTVPLTAPLGVLGLMPPMNMDMGGMAPQGLDTMVFKQVRCARGCAQCAARAVRFCFARRVRLVCIVDLAALPCDSPSS
jgi:hypothetical protein